MGHWHSQVKTGEWKVLGRQSTLFLEPILTVSRGSRAASSSVRAVVEGSWGGFCGEFIKAFDQQNRMALLLLPILGQASQTQAQTAGSQLGPLLRIGQNDQPTVLGQEMQLPFPLRSNSHFGEQRGADLLLLLLLLLCPCTESETPWTGRSETCHTPRQNETPPGNR